MLSHITVGAKDLDRAGKFYDAVAAELGAKRVAENERSISWAREGLGRFGVIKPFNGEEATFGNGFMAGFPPQTPPRWTRSIISRSRWAAKTKGPPGWRSPNFYGAYFRDLDGNKVTVFCRK